MTACSFNYFVIFVLPIFGAVEFRADYQFSDKVDGWLKFHLIPATWHDAMLRCQLEGAEIASPTNREMLKAMVDMMYFKQSPNPPRAVFTGIHATYSKADYYTVKGVPLSKLNLNWAPNEPDNRVNTEDCLILHPGDATISDVTCDRVYPYMCYRQRTNDMPPISNCGTIDPEYRFDNRTGSCYKYHYVTRKWARAVETCSAEGGYLAIPNSALEMRIFKELFDKPETGPYRNHRIVYLGFRYVEEWVTIHGQTQKQAGYDEWAKGSPTNVPTHHPNPEECCGLNLNSAELGLENWDCKKIEYFICEMTPPGGK